MAVLPDFSAATFVPGAAIDNPYFPLTRNNILSYRAEENDPDTGEIASERNDLFTTNETLTVRGVETTVIRDTVYEDEVLLEDTLDFYAQERWGTSGTSARSSSTTSMTTRGISSVPTTMEPGSPTSQATRPASS